MNALLSMKVVPVLNGNDVVAPTPQMDLDLENVSLTHEYKKSGVNSFLLRRGSGNICTEAKR